MLYLYRCVSCGREKEIEFQMEEKKPSVIACGCGDDYMYRQFNTFAIKEEKNNLQLESKIKNAIKEAKEGIEQQKKERMKEVK